MAASRSTVRSRRRRKIVLAFTSVALAVAIGAPATVPAATSSPITYFSATVLNADTRPFWITPGPDGNLWFTDTNADRIGRITMKGRVTLFKAETGSKPYTIVSGPDGNLWFTEWQKNKLGVMDTRGNFLHKYPVGGSVELNPYGIAVSPDGYIWFTAYNFDDPSAVDTVGRVSTDGSFVETYQLNPCACEPLGITTGPDGNMWITEELGAFDGEGYGAVDRVSLDGKEVTRFQMPDSQSLPAWISPGPDGKLWFGQYNAEHHQLGTASTDGVITNYHINNAISNTVAATAGPDGKVWFTEGDANDIWSMKTDGTLVDNFPTGVHATPAGITIGPDGNLWFAVAGSGEIGRLHTARRNTRYVLDIASGFVPTARTAKLGQRVEWVLEAPGMHEARDTTGLDLFASGLKPPVSFLRHVFTAAGTFPYRDSTSGDRGAIRVPIEAPSRARVDRPFTIRFAVGASPEAGQAFDVQIMRPGTRSWADLRTGTRNQTATVTPRRTGRFHFRARFTDTTGGHHSGWSPAGAVRVR